MGILEQVLGFFSKNKKNILYILIFIVCFFHSGDFAFASGSETSTASQEKSVIIQGLNGFLAIVGSLLGLLTMFVGLFLRPEWTSGSVIGLDTQLKTMWILISNIVYFVFAGIFITIAFMNIIGHGDHYELKKAIPKFIVGVLIVPFSWFFVQFVLSISSVLTVGVLSLPYDTFKDLDLANKKVMLCPIGDQGGVTVDLSASGASNIIKCKGGDKKPVTLGDFIKQYDNGGLYSIMTIYTFGVMRLDETGLLYGKELKGGISNLWGLSVKLIFDLVFLVVYTLLLVALFLAFMTRGIALWFYVMFSPVFGLLHYFGHAKDGMGEGAAKKFNLHEFIALAMVPVYVAGALSFGIVFLHVAGKGFKNSGVQTGKNNVLTLEKDSARIGNTTFTFPAGKTIDPNDDTSLFGGFTGPIGALMIQMLGLAVIWVAVMSALHSSKITGNVTEPIAHFGDEIGKLVAKAPTYAPILPGGLSAQGLQSAGSSFSSAVQNDFTQKGAKFGQDTARQFGFGDEDMNKLKQMALMHSYAPGEKTQKGIQELLSSIKADRLVDENYRSAVGDVLRKLGAKDELVKEVVANGKNRDKLGDILHDFKGAKGWTNDKINDANRIFEGKTNKQIDEMIGGGGSSGTSSSGLPSSITKNQNGDKVTVNIAKLDNEGNATNNKVDFTVNKGKVDDASKLGDVFKSYSGKYNESEFKSLLSELGITDPDQIKQLVKTYFNR